VKKQYPFEGRLIICIFPVMCLLIFVATLARATGLFTQYLTWTEEAARYLMIWMAFLAVGIAAKDNSHFRMAAFVDNLPPGARKIVNFIASLISILFMCALVYYGFAMILRQMETGQLSPILKIYMWIPYLAIPIGILDMAVRTAVRTVRELRMKKGNGEVAE